MSNHLSSNKGQVRHIPLQGQSNFRDIEGYKTRDGRTVKWGEVYRSGRFPKLTDDDVACLENLDIKTVVNLLTPEDKEAYGRDRLPDGEREVSLPIDSKTAKELANMLNKALKASDFSLIDVAMNLEIHRLLIHDGQEQYAVLLRAIADPDNRPLVFHCSHCVNRTGTGAAILLSALGVSWDVVREDYLLSNKIRHDEVQKRLGQLRQMAAEKRGISPKKVDMNNMEAFLIQDGAYIDVSKAEMIDEFGSVNSYLTDGLG